MGWRGRSRGHSGGSVSASARPGFPANSDEPDDDDDGRLPHILPRAGSCCWLNATKRLAQVLQVVPPDGSTWFLGAGGGAGETVGGGHGGLNGWRRWRKSKIERERMAVIIFQWHINVKAVVYCWAAKDPSPKEVEDGGNTHFNAWSWCYSPPEQVDVHEICFHGHMGTLDLGDVVGHYFKIGKKYFLNLMRFKFRLYLLY